MVRVIGVGTGGPESCPPESLAALRAATERYHVDSRHPSFEWLAEIGFPCAPVPECGVPDGAVLVAPILPHAASDTSRSLETGSSYDPESPKRKARAQALEALVQVVDRLLGPDGCPWDREQTHASLKRHLLEEVYETLEAIDSGSKERLKEELGDLLLQPLMHAQMERVAGSFDIEDVAEAARSKLIRRHPHVFGPLSASDAEEVLRNWDRIKQSERDPSGADEGEKRAPRSILAGVPSAMPALLRAFELSKRAARVGFEWPDIESVFAKMREEEAELRAALVASKGLEEGSSVEEEVGDLLFTVVNIARWAGVEPEDALRRMLDRFSSRFQYMEREAIAPLRALTPEQWDELWERSKIAVAGNL